MPKKSKPINIPPIRSTVIFRLNPGLANWYTDSATKSGRSRNDYMQAVLYAVRDLVTDAEQWERDGLSPFDGIEVLGPIFIEKLVDLGLGNEFLAEIVKHHRAKQRAALIEVEKEKAKAGK